MKKAIISVVGHDNVGIIARICTYLADNKINILDISQTIVSGYFNMMMVVDVANIEMEFSKLAEDLSILGDDIGVTVHCQREDIFTSMHRI